MLYIEFIGVPGAGKSTLKKRIFQMLREKNYKNIFSIEELLWSSLKKRRDDIFTPILLNIFPKKIAQKYIYGIFRTSWSTLFAPGRFIVHNKETLWTILLSDHFKRIESDEGASAFSSFLEMTAIYQMVDEEADPEAYVVFDKGFIQTAMELFMSPKLTPGTIDQKALSGYLETIPIPNVLIWVETDIEKCVSRMFNRSEGRALRLVEMDQSELLLFLSNCNKNFHKIATLLKEKGKKVIHIENNASLDQATDQIFERIQHTLLKSR